VTKGGYRRDHQIEEGTAVRVISAPNFGPPNVLRIEERPAPRPKADEVVVEVKLRLPA
jgi:hypothetical protein